MSKSSANPRKYSRGKDAIDASEPLVVYVEIRLEKADILTLNDRLEYLASRRPASSISVAGIRRETSKIIVTLAIDMGPIGEALRGDGAQMQDGYDLTFDLWENLVEYAPVFASAPGAAEASAAEALGFAPAPRPASADAVAAAI